VRELVAGEGEPEGGVDAFAVEEVEQVLEVAFGFGLVAGQVGGNGLLAFVDHQPADAAAVGGAAVGAAAELGHGDRLPEPAVGADQVGEPGGVLGVAVGVDRDDVERLPVDLLPGPRRVGDRAAEQLPGAGGDRA
jgi:hypothetical protein